MLCTVCAELEYSDNAADEALAAELVKLREDTKALFTHVFAIRKALAELSR